MSESNITLHSNTGVGTLDLPANAPREGESFGKLSVRRFASGSAILQRIFSFPAMLASLLVGAVLVPGRRFIVDPDIWWHVKVGDTILKTDHWPTTDPYSFTAPGQPWIAHEWLGDVLFAAAYRLAGISGLDFILILIGSAIVVSLYAFASLRSGNSKAGFLASTLLLVLAAVSFTMRPQMLGYLFLILTLIALELFRQGKHRALWFLPPLMLLWVNTHGTWIFGLGTILVYWLSGLVDFRLGSLHAHPWTATERIQISGAFLLCLAALPLNPYGTRIAEFPFELAFSMPLSVKYIWEFQPIPFNVLGGQLFLALLMGMLLVHVLYQFSWRLEELFLFVFGATLACMHVRFLLVCVPFFAPLLATVLARWMSSYDRSKDKLVLNAVLMASVAVGIFCYFPSRAELEGSVAGQFPVAAVKYIDRNAIPGPMFNTWDFGGYLLWSRGPEQKVFMDGRSEIYERGGVLSDYVHIAGMKPGTLAVLRGYQVQSCLLARHDDLATLLSASSEWRRVYIDQVSMIFVRVPSSAAAPLVAGVR